MRLDKYINEIKLTKKTQFHKKGYLYGEWSAEFSVGKYDYEVIFQETYDGEWYLMFKLTDADIYNLEQERKKEMGEFSLTNLGNPIAVFRGVLNAIKEWYNDVGFDAKELKFSVEEEPYWLQGSEKKAMKEVQQRKKLYMKSIPMIEKITKMKFKGIKEMGRESFTFTFARKQ